MGFNSAFKWLISQNYFWNEILRVSDSSSVHHQEFFTVHTVMVYVIQVCWQLTWSCSQAVSKPVWHIPLLCVQWKTLDNGQRNCPKHVEFYSKNKFEKLVHLVSFIIRIYYFVLRPTNAQLFHKSSHSHVFRHYCVILRELVTNTLPGYTSI